MEEGAAGRPNAYSLSLVMVGLSRDGQHRAAAQLWSLGDFAGERTTAMALATERLQYMYMH